MVLRIFQDKTLSGMLVGLTMLKILKGEFKIRRPIRRLINGVKIDFLILRKLGKNSSQFGLLWKDLDEKDEHFHFFSKKDSVGVGLVITDETKPYPSPDRNMPVDNRKFFRVFGKEVDSYFKNFQEVVGINTSKFDSNRIITYNPIVTTDKIRKKILHMKLEENEKEVTTEEFKKMDKAIGIALSKHGKADEFVVKKGDKIYCFDYTQLRKIALELFPILKEGYK